MDKLLIRADGNSEIGSGHIMRCSAIAAEALANGCEVMFAVSDEASRKLVESRGFSCEVVGGDYRSFGDKDADLLADLAKEYNTSLLLIDSYAVSNTFFSRLAERGMQCCYIDDAYTFDSGFAELPTIWNVEAVINYSFGFNVSDYRAVYSGSSTALHIGPSYAPIRAGFRDLTYAVRDKIANVLVTSGMTNPNRALERMAHGCRMALPNARITVVVGGAADFDNSCLVGTDFETVENVQDMANLMVGTDLAVSAAGSTLYELACVGVPMIAVPIVDNQIGNARGLTKLGLGSSLGSARWTANDICSSILDITPSYSTRYEFSIRGRNVIDGYGARRIYEAIELMLH